MTALRVSLAQKLAYGLGDFGFSLFFLTASLYLLYYYTDVLGLDPSVAGWVFGGALIWDAIFDLVMGGVANRTRSRWGRYRPYLLFGAVPLALVWVLVFLPTGFTGTALIAWAATVHILFRTLYAVAYMPYLALSAAITRDSNQRSALAAFRMVGQAMAGLLAAFMTLKLVELFGGGQVGFFRVAAIYSVVAAVLLVVVFAVSREVSTAAEDAAPPPSFAAMARMLRANGPFWLICGALLIGYVAGVFFNKSIPYYVKYGLHRADLIGPSLGVLSAMITLGIPVWAFTMKRTSKRRVFLTGTAIALVAYAAIWFAPQEVRFWMPLLALLGFGTGGIYLSTWAMLPDTVEYGEWKTGVRAEGAVFGCVSLIQKASLGLAAGMLGQILSAIGYKANVEQHAGTIDALRLVMIGGPALFAATAAAFVWFYPLDTAMHGRLVKVLGRRKPAVA